MRLTPIGLLFWASISAAAQTSQPAPTRLPFDPSLLRPSRDSFEIRVQGAPLGFLVTTVETTSSGFRFTEHSSVGGLVEQTTSVELLASGEMSRVRQTGTVQGQPTSVEIDYSAGRAKGQAKSVSAEGPKSVTVDTVIAPGTIDDNALQELLPALPWAPSASWTFLMFSGGQNEARTATLKVIGTDSIPGPSGAVQAYQVEWSGGWQPATFWIAVEAPHRLLKIAIANSPVTVVRVK